MSGTDDEPVLDERLANALVPGVQPAGLAKGIAPVLSAFNRYYGGLWVGGRAQLTETHLKFSPNAMNTSLHDRDTSFAVPLNEIVRVSLEKGWVTNIIALETSDGSRRIRCFRAADFIRAIEAAAART